jgi:hypothetical protein
MRYLSRSIVIAGLLSLSTSVSVVKADDAYQTMNNLNPLDVAELLFDPSLISSGVLTVSGASFTGASQSSGITTLTTHHDVETAVNPSAASIQFVTLTTGLLSSAARTEKFDFASTGNGQPGDADLWKPKRDIWKEEQTSTYDAAVLSFDALFTQDTNISFNYVFASEEYAYGTPDFFNDVFGVFIGGSSLDEAEVGGVSLTVDTVDPQSNSQDFVPNFDHTRAMDYSGRTVVLSTDSYKFLGGVLTHVKLAISDAGDSGYDSAVYIVAGSQVIDVQCAGLYEQCGGQDWTGTTCCADTGAFCSARSKWYSNCQPAGGTPYPTFYPSVGPTQAGCVADWSQCGGQGYTGPTCCAVTTSVCSARSIWYSNCIPYGSATYPPFTTPAPTDAPTEAPTNGPDCAADWGQCGGQDWTGATCCQTSSFTCTYGNQWYSDCQPSP